MTKHIALVVDSPYPDFGIERAIIERAGGTLVTARAEAWDEEHLLDQPLLGMAEVILVGLAPITARVLLRATSCRLVVRYGIGVDNVDVEAATAAGIWVANIPGYATSSVADHTMMLLLSLARGLRLSTKAVRSGAWRSGLGGHTPLGLNGRVLGIVGYGHIGSAVGQRALAMGLQAYAYDPFVPTEQIAPTGVVGSDLESLLRHSDFLSLHCPLTEDTHHLICKRTIDLMKPGVIVINTARGGLIDLDDLLEALGSGRVGGAGLDVFDKEPLLAGHALGVHPGVIATPHVAYLSDSSLRELRTSVAENAAAVLGGGPPLTPLNAPENPRAGGVGACA